jgi:ACR3 family arsenite transporter
MPLAARRQAPGGRRDISGGTDILIGATLDAGHDSLDREEGIPMTARLLAKLEDFRLLPVFVVVSMAIGIGIGKTLSISDFALTPPIDALKAIAGGTFQLTVPNVISLGVPLGLFAMMYPAMTNVRLGEVGEAVRAPRQLAVVLLFNYLVAPFVMLGLANLFVSDPELHTGLVLYGLAPCIAMVIIFTFLAKGNTPMALVFVALNSVAQMILIPVYARLLIGNVSFDVWVVAESVVLYLGLPLVLGIVTRRVVTRRGGEAAMDRLKPGLSALSILGLLFTLIVMFSLKGDLILERPGIVLEMAIPMALFFALMFFVVLFVGSRLRFPYGDAVAVAFNATGRDFEIAIAIAISAFSPTVALATVVGPLIEVPVMLALVWAAMRLGPRWFPAPIREEAPSTLPATAPGH